MKAVPKVGLDGLYIEDVLVDDAFAGVVPFYEQISLTQDAEGQGSNENKEAEDVLAGYIVGIPVTERLYLPKFDLDAWHSYQEALMAADATYQQQYDAWLALPSEERGEMPMREHIEAPVLWLEGLAPEEIQKRSEMQKLGEPETLQAENSSLKLALAELAEAHEAEKIEMQMALCELGELVAKLGGE